MLNMLAWLLFIWKLLEDNHWLRKWCRGRNETSGYCPYAAEALMNLTLDQLLSMDNNTTMYEPPTTGQTFRDLVY